MSNSDLTKEKRFTRAWGIVQANGKVGDVYPYWRGGCTSAFAKKCASESLYEGEKLRRVRIFVEKP